MGLEEEIQQFLYRATAADPNVLKAQVTGEAVETGLDDAVVLLYRQVGAIEQAILMLARAIDEDRGDQ